MRRRILIGFLFLTAPVFADEAGLPFAPDRVQRLSLDGVPRSLSIRQGDDFWLGYDLERGTPFHVWRAKPGTTGLIVDGFTTRSQGETRFTDSSEHTWRVRRNHGDAVPTTLRHLSCSDRGDAIELGWEVRHEGGSIRIHERVPHQPEEPPDGGVIRVVEVEGLPSGWRLLLPESTTDAWTLLDAGGKAASAIEGNGVFRIILP